MIGIFILSFDRFKIHSAMFAQWADDIFRKFIAFIDISADFAYPAFFAFSLWLWFYMFLIVGVSHGLLIVHDTGLCDAADEHSVSTKIYVIFHFQRHESIDIFVQEYQSIVRVVHFLACKFIGASAGLEADAQAKLQEAEQKVREADETLSGMQAEAEQLRADAMKQADAEAAARLAGADAEKQKILAAAKAQAAREKDAMLREANEQIGALVSNAVDKLVSDADDPYADFLHAVKRGA